MKNKNNFCHSFNNVWYALVAGYTQCVWTIAAKMEVNGFSLFIWWYFLLDCISGRCWCSDVLFSDTPPGRILCCFSGIFNVVRPFQNFILMLYLFFLYLLISRRTLIPQYISYPVCSDMFEVLCPLQKLLPLWALVKNCYFTSSQI